MRDGGREGGLIRERGRNKEGQGIVKEEGKEWESEKEMEGGHLKVGGRLLNMFYQVLLHVLECVPPVTTHIDGYTMQC